jgi:ribonuclease-3
LRFPSLFQTLSKSDKKLSVSLTNICGKSPINIELYKLAFRHSSASHTLKGNITSSNERLEFLGDAVLGSVVAHFLFTTFPYRDEGFLTKMRSRIVSRKNINKLALKLGLDRFIDAININSIGFKSMNGDALEALIGAIYLDRGYQAAQYFIIDRVIKTHVDLDAIENNDSDFKSKIIEWGQREKKSVRFDLVGEEGKGHEKFYTVDLFLENKPYGVGKGFSKKIAEQLAAEMACEKLSL